MAKQIQVYKLKENWWPFFFGEHFADMTLLIRVISSEITMNYQWGIRSHFMV